MTSPDDDGDRALAEKLQRQYDAELLASERQQREDCRLALRLAACENHLDSTSTTSPQPATHSPSHIPEDVGTVSSKRPRVVDEAVGGESEGVGESVECRRRRVACRYGDQCYRRANPTHCRQYWHSGDSDTPQAANISTSARSSSRTHMGAATARKPLRIAERLTAAQPVSLFLTKVRSLRGTWHESLSLSLPELFDPSLGCLQASLQLNFIVDVAWLLGAYSVYDQDSLPLTVVCGQCVDDSYRPPENVSVHTVRMPFAFGVHHTKLMVLQYTEGLRVVVHTANLIEPDWTDKTQGMWISPLLPALTVDGGQGESVTGFRRDLLTYLRSYRLPCLRDWCDLVMKHDFSAVPVFLVGSVPGKHPDGSPSTACWGHRRLAQILRSQTHESSPVSNHVTRSRQQLLVLQCSSIGSLGTEADRWLLSQLAPSMTVPDTSSPSCAVQPTGDGSVPRKSLSAGAECGDGSRSLLDEVHRPLVRVIYPCEDDVRNSVEGELLGGSSLAYRHSTHVRQPWLGTMMCRWRSEWRGRTAAMPHVKTYTQLSVPRTSHPGTSHAVQCRWFLLTSANLSKAAWGCVQSGGRGSGSHLFIRSYELGVLFVPGMFGVEYFEVEPESGNCGTNDKRCALSFPYSLPLVGYTRDDRPWFPDSPTSSVPR